LNAERLVAEIEWEGDVGSDDAGLRLDQFLADHVGSRARAARLVSAGLVEVGGRAVAKRYAVASGDHVVVAREQQARQTAPGLDPGHPATQAIQILYEDEALIIVDKPAGVVVHPAKGHETGTLAQALADRAAGGEDPYRAGIVHRLDRDTSGLLVVAKSDDAHRKLKDLLQARDLRREYLTLVDGLPPAHSGTIDAPIGRDRRDRVLHSIDTDAPREARTHFELLEPLAHEAFLRVSLETGRTHQIRVHMTAIGHPVVGDSAYGGPIRFGLERQFLHAARLAFPHPQSGEEIDVSSPLPADLAAALELARAQSR
jgi:23S rRNA pseudouridine1911/1915/1917 synthase